VGGDVFTWKAGPTYSRGKYTVAGLSVGFPNALPDTTPRVQLGQTNDLLVTTQIPTNNTGTISFPGIFFIADNISVKNRQTGVYDALLSSYDVATWRAFYLTEEQTAELHYVATAVVPYGFTVKYELTDTTPTSVTNNLAFEAIRIQSEPVTSELATGGFVYNPSGMPLGSDARFKIAIADGAVPEEDITWTVTSGAGCVSFVNDNNAGPDIAIHADSVGDFTLEVNVKGLVITPPNVRPCFSGKVLPAVSVPVSVFIVRKTDQTEPARQDSEIADLLADANKILRQRGITLVQNGAILHLDNDAWLNHTNALAQTNAVIDAMMDSTNSLGQAVELYFVKTLDGGDLKGARRSKGIAISSGTGVGRTITHEVLHDCGTGATDIDDIYPVRNDSDTDTDPIPGMVRQEWISADWGGGYYAPDLSQRELVDRLIMRSGGYNDPSPALSIDLPSGSVFGYHDSMSNGVPTRVLGPAAVGQDSCTGTPGSL
jgi:hypothetical protein